MHRMPRPSQSQLTIASRIVLALAALGCAAAAAHQAPYWWSAFKLHTSIAVFAAAALTVLTLVWAAFRAQSKNAQRLAAEVMLLGFALLIVEIILVAAKPGTWSNNPIARQILDRERLAWKVRRAFDPRTRSEVVTSLRAAGFNAVPGIEAGWVQLDEVRVRLPDGFYPLTQLSFATVVECNEGGQYLIYETDEFGLNNPRGLLASGRIDIAAVGESHTLGHCVPAGQGMVDLIRRVHPRTLNLGLGGVRPLTQLAAFREYVEPLRAPVVLWIVNPGFAIDESEARDPILVRYLEPSFSQNLLHRQSEVDAAVRSLTEPLQAKRDLALRAELARARTDRFHSVPKLEQVRQRLGPKPKEVLREPSLSLFRETLRIAHAAAASWGGQLFVVILPGQGHVRGERPEIVRYEAVMNILREERWPVIDGAALFNSLKDPDRVYTFGPGAHPNAEGHALLAGHILAALRGARALPAEVEEVDVDERGSGADSKSVRTGVRAEGELFSELVSRH